MDQLHMYLPGMLLAYSAFLLATLSPGPALLATIATSMSAGRSPAIMLALGVAAGSFCWAVMTAVGLSALLAAYAGALIAIKIFGGGYLLWLAFKAFRSARRAGPLKVQGGTVPDLGAAGHFLRGWLVQITNPKSILGWIAIISLGLRPGAPFWVGMVIIAATTTTAIIYYGGCAVMFSTAKMVAVYGRLRRWIDAGLGAFFAFAAIKLLTSWT